MPGSVANAAPVDVLPQILCSAFTEVREYAVQENRYQNGESQARALVTNSRKRYQVSRRLTASELTTLRDFWLAHRFEPFYMYNPWETSFMYDGTGSATTGRHTVRFDGEWSETAGLFRSDVSVQLIEVA